MIHVKNGECSAQGSKQVLMEDLCAILLSFLVKDVFTRDELMNALATVLAAYDKATDIILAELDDREDIGNAFMEMLEILNRRDK